MTTYKSESNIKPNEWQVEKTCVYHNYNIKEKKKESEAGETISYVYDVDEYTLNEYVQYQLANNATSIKDLEDAVCEIGEIIGG